MTPLPQPAAPTAPVQPVPGEGAAGGLDGTGTQVPGSESVGPVALPVLPATGTDSLGLGRAGLFAVAAGLPLLVLGCLRRRRLSGALRRSG